MWTYSAKSFFAYSVLGIEGCHGSSGSARRRGALWLSVLTEPKNRGVGDALIRLLRVRFVVVRDGEPT